MSQNDFIQKFIFEHAPVRGVFIRLEKTVQDTIASGNYPPMVANLLGEALLSAVLVANSIKFEGSLSLQFQGDAHFPLLLVQVDHQLNVRACARFTPDLTTEDYAKAFLGGRLALTIQQDNQTEAYQSFVPLQSTSMGENLMFYFAQSEQLATHISLAIGNGVAAGFMVQLMPGGSEQEREEFWSYAMQIGQTVREDELLTLETPVLLHRLYHEVELRLFDAAPVQFKCRCSHEKMRQVLQTLGEQDAHDLLKEQGKISVTCDFCHKVYDLDVIDVEFIFRTK